VIVDVIAIVVVIEPVDVAALVSGNVPVVVTDTGNETVSATEIVPGVGYVHGVVPAHERGHDHGDRSRSRSRSR
jgi:hypothetical protein